MEKIHYTGLDSPIGEIWVAWDNIGVCCVSLATAEEAFVKKIRRSMRASPSLNAKVHRDITDEITAYFAGKLTRFSVPLHPAGAPFDMAVWEALRRIPFGETRSYQDVAQDVGNPRACRAVGSANSRNPIPLIIPCHRVIRSNGSLGGFGAGVGIKEWLLAFERNIFLGRSETYREG